MTEASPPWEHALDRPGTAGYATMRNAWLLTAIIVGLTGVVLVFGSIQLPPYPQFAIFHTGFVFLVDAIIAFLLFGQFAFRRLPSYAVLGAGFAFNALIMIPSLLAFPGALTETGSVIGGLQSSVWLWHCWHAVFPAIVALSLLVDGAAGDRRIARRDVGFFIGAALATIALLVLVITFAVTVFHDRLPVLVDERRVPVADSFYWVGALTLVITTVALLLAAWRAQGRTVLHVWLTLLLLAFLGDVITSLAAYPRYTLGWYLGRIDSMLATGTLLAVFLNDINHLYYRLARALRELFAVNRRLSAAIRQKDAAIAELRESEARVRRLAYHDTITDLPNRRGLMEALRNTLARAERYGHTTAVLFVDLDRFKEVNDRLGHDVGDELLREVARRLTSCVRAGDIVSRLGGDEFVIVLPEISTLDDALPVADKILGELAETMVIEGHRIQITASVGIAIGGAEHWLDANELVRRADEAMYAAKQAGRNRCAVSGAS